MLWCPPVKSVYAYQIMVVPMEQCLKIILAAEECAVERNHCCKRAMQCKQRIPFFVVKVAGKRFDELRFRLYGLIVHHQ